MLPPARAESELATAPPAHQRSPRFTPDVRYGVDRTNGEQGSASVNILALTRYSRLGASSRLRMYQYLPFLSDHGWNVDVQPLLDDRYLRDVYEGRPRQATGLARAYGSRILSLLGSRRYDLLWIQRELFPSLPGLVEYLLRTSGVRYVVDYDDATFHRYDRSRSRLVRLTMGNKIDHVMGGAALVVAGNDYLADRARRAGSQRVEVIPTVVDLDRYPASSPETDHATVRIGWIGTPSTVEYLTLVAGPLRSATSGGSARLIVIGAEPRELTDVPIDPVPWSEDTEVEALRSIDIGIMPLPDEPWEQGKCGYKLIQYMASARPVVASPVGVNPTIVQDGKSGFIAANDGEWTASLERLIADPVLREEMGQHGRSRAETRFSLRSHAPQLIDLLEAAATR